MFGEEEYTNTTRGLKRKLVRETRPVGHGATSRSLSGGQGPAQKRAREHVGDNDPVVVGVGFGVEVQEDIAPDIGVEKKPTRVSSLPSFDSCQS